ncbi:MAG: hypothetical protein Q7K26_06170 [bacterium]|nr:hypothetical protein [bacterium]
MTKMNTQNQAKNETIPTQPVSRSKTRSNSGTGAAESKVVSVRLSGPQQQRIEQLAEVRGIASSRVLSLMLDDYLNQQSRLELQDKLIVVANELSTGEVNRTLRLLANRLNSIEGTVGRLEKLLLESGYAE